MVTALVLGCAVNIPEEWLPLVGEWTILEYGESGVNEEKLYFNSYDSISFEDIGERYGLYGEHIGENNTDSYYCILTADNPGADFSPDQYKYNAIWYAYNRELGDYVYAHFYYFNMVAENTIEGVYMEVSFVLPQLNDWEYRSFSGTK